MRLTLLQALVDSESNKCHAKLSKMPKWIQDQALPTTDKCPFTGWGSSFQAEHEVVLPFRLTQFAPKTEKLNTKYSFLIQIQTHLPL
jgi:hypothetical protein